MQVRVALKRMRTAVGGGGGTQADALADYARFHGVPLETVAGERPMLPDGVEELWHAFWDMSMARGSSGFGPASIGYTDIDAYCRVSGVKFTPWEVDTMVLLDLIWRADFAEQRKAEQVQGAQHAGR